MANVPGIDRGLKAMIAGALAIDIGQGHFYFGSFLDHFNVQGVGTLVYTLFQCFLDSLQGSVAGDQFHLVLVGLIEGLHETSIGVYDHEPG